jgi:hypothetical protein
VIDVVDFSQFMHCDTDTSRCRQDIEATLSGGSGSEAAKNIAKIDFEERTLFAMTAISMRASSATLHRIDSLIIFDWNF